MSILVVGFGNTLVGDDGCGLEVVRRLTSQLLPPGTRAVEGYSDSLLLPALWKGESQVWLIDALIRDQTPGAIYTVGHDELLAIPQRHGTAHQLSLPESLRWIQLVHPDMAHIRYFMWGVEPEHFRIGAPLSNTVRMAVDVVVDQVLRELAIASNSHARCHGTLKPGQAGTFEKRPLRVRGVEYRRERSLVATPLSEPL